MLVTFSSPAKAKAAERARFYSHAATATKALCMCCDCMCAYLCIGVYLPVCDGVRACVQLFVMLFVCMYV